MKAIFVRKAVNLNELKKITKEAKKKGYKGQAYKILREVVLEAKDFEVFTTDFLEDQPWITKDDGGINPEGQVLCIRVINKDTGAKLLVNTEGYDYSRYIAIEK